MPQTNLDNIKIIQQNILEINYTFSSMKCALIQFTTFKNCDFSNVIFSDATFENSKFVF
jgi:uncharacterized protein YjbI with pentapeptide repeats